MPLKDPKKHRAYQAKYRAENPEKVRTSQAKYRAENRKLMRAFHAKHRAERLSRVSYKYQKRVNGGYFSHASWEYLKSLFGHRCVYCGQRMERLTQDHIIPISKGGWHFSGNIVPACRSCNSRKHARLLTNR